MKNLNHFLAEVNAELQFNTITSKMQNAEGEVIRQSSTFTVNIVNSTTEQILFIRPKTMLKHNVRLITASWTQNYVGDNLDAQEVWDDMMREVVRTLNARGGSALTADTREFTDAILPNDLGAPVCPEFFNI